MRQNNADLLAVALLVTLFVNKSNLYRVERACESDLLLIRALVGQGVVFFGVRDQGVELYWCLNYDRLDRKGPGDNGREWPFCLLVSD